MRSRYPGDRHICLEGVAMIRSRFRRLDSHTFGVLLGAAAAVLALLPATASGQTQTWAIAGQVTVPIDGVPMTFQIPPLPVTVAGGNFSASTQTEPFNVNGCQTVVTSTFNGSFDRVLNLTWNGTVTSTPASECFNASFTVTSLPSGGAPLDQPFPNATRTVSPGTLSSTVSPGTLSSTIKGLGQVTGSFTATCQSGCGGARRRRRRRRRSFRRTLRQVRRRLWALSHWRRRQFRRRTSGSASMPCAAAPPD